MIKYKIWNTFTKESGMNKIKDFFYNKNDIIIVLVILAAAAVIIYGRINAIMDYPVVLAEQAAVSQSSESSAAQSSSSDAADPSATETVSQTDKADAAGTEYVTVTIKSSDTAESVASKLYKAGLVKSADSFRKHIDKKGSSDSIKAGKYNIPKGSSNNEILDIISK